MKFSASLVLVARISRRGRQTLFLGKSLKEQHDVGSRRLSDVAYRRTHLRGVLDRDEGPVAELHASRVLGLPEETK